MQIFLGGCHDDLHSNSDVLTFDPTPTREVWDTAGNIINQRMNHAVTTLSSEETENLSDFCRWMS